MARTLEQVRTELAQWEACLTAISTGKEYRIGTRWMARANLGQVNNIVKELRREDAALDRGQGSGIRAQKSTNIAVGFIP